MRGVGGRRDAERGGGQAGIKSVRPGRHVILEAEGRGEGMKEGVGAGAGEEWKTTEQEGFF